MHWWIHFEVWSLFLYRSIYDSIRARLINMFMKKNISLKKTNWIYSSMHIPYTSFNYCTNSKLLIMWLWGSQRSLWDIVFDYFGNSQIDVIYYLLKRYHLFNNIGDYGSLIIYDFVIVKNRWKVANYILFWIYNSIPPSC